MAVTHQFQALLLIQPADEGDDRLFVVGEPEPLSQRPLVVVLLLDGLGVEVRRDVRVGFGIELFVVQTVQHAAKFVVMRVQRGFETVRPARRPWPPTRGAAKPWS